MNPWEPLFASLGQLVPIPPEEQRAFLSLSTDIRLSKGDLWIREGDPVDSVGICAEGLLRLFYTTPDGAEYNKSFCVKHDFVASYSALLLGVPSFLSVQALTDSRLIVIRHADLQALYDRHPCWERLGRRLAERLFMKKETRERDLLLLPAEARYRLFLEQYGPMLPHIPQYHIASYLGITPVALSRIRKKINLG